jgi:hypothetical protein
MTDYMLWLLFLQTMIIVFFLDFCWAFFWFVSQSTQASGRSTSVFSVCRCAVIPQFRVFPELDK